jgi:hypothetical protein
VQATTTHKKQKQALTQRSMALVLIGLVVLAAVVAVLLGKSVWATSLGAALVVVYWLLELLFIRRARQASSGGAVAVTLAGMLVRFVIVLGSLVALGVWRRPVFLDAVVGFLGAYTVYMMVRLLSKPALPAHSK